MKAIVKTSFTPGITVKEIPAPQPGRDPIVRIERAAICGTDVHMFQDMSAYQKAAVPVVMGHEACGVIADRGKAG